MAHRRSRLFAIAALPCVLFGCGGDGAPPGTATASVAPGTIQQIDAYPFYFMRFDGGYGFPDYLRRGQQAAVPSRGAAAPGWACTVFAAMSGGDGPLLGRNFDFFHRASMLLLTQPPDGFSSLSMVDLYYCGFSGTVSLQELEANRERLRRAPYVPFDGVNERGVAIGLMAVPSAQPPFDPSKVSLCDLALIRLVLDQAQSAEHAVGLLRNYNYIPTPATPVHFLIADARGNSAIVEYVAGDIKVIWNGEPYLVATNFTVFGSGAPTDVPCDRYRTAYVKLNERNGSLSTSQAMDLLRGVRQAITMWSVVYGLRTRKASVALGGTYERVHEFSAGF